MKRAVILLSGGLDSATAMAIARSEGYEIYTLSFDYAQRHKIELEAARVIAERYDSAKHLVINFNLGDIGGSALTDDIEVPKNRIQSVDSIDIPITYVPARNTIFLSFALSWAESIRSTDIFIGANAIDYSGYPDCRPEYIRAFEDMANLATKISVEEGLNFRVHAPLIKLTKSQIIKRGTELGVDYSLTWSCYDPVFDEDSVDREHKTALPCLRCDSCRLREKGFKEAGIKDPLLDKIQPQK